MFSQILWGREWAKRYPNPQNITNKITAKFIKENHDVMIKNNDSFYAKMWEEFVETNKISHDELISDVNGLLGSALDSISVSIELLVLILCKHKRLQYRLYNELKDVFGGGSGDVAIENITDLYSTMIKQKKLNTLRAYVHEVLRMYTPAPVNNWRVCDDRDIDIGWNNYIIPKGTTFQLNLFHINHDKKYWKIPDKFDINNFLNENGTFKKNDTFLAFSIGNRKCPGDMLAMKILYMTLALLLMKYEFTADDGGVEWEIEVKGAGLMHAHPQFKVIFTPRE